MSDQVVTLNTVFLASRLIGVLSHNVHYKNAILAGEIVGPVVDPEDLDLNSISPGLCLAISQSWHDRIIVDKDTNHITSNIVMMFFSVVKITVCKGFVFLFMLNAVICREMLEPPL